MTAALASALFAPRAVAIIGASGDPAKTASRPQRYLRRHGYRGRIYPINRERTEVLGERAYRSLADIPGEVDHAIVMAAAADVPALIDECAASRIPVASVFSDGFAERGEAGARLEEDLVGRARAGGVRVLGPNSLGVIDVNSRCALSANAVLEIERLPPGDVGLVSQSGSIIGTILSRGSARGFGFSRLVSVGNEADIGLGELVELLVDDPQTAVILLFLESLRRAPALARAARRAADAGKPVVAYKLGRSAVGRSLALTHTGALAGEDAIADAFFAAHGIVRVDHLETLVEIAPLLRGRRPPAGPVRRAAPGRVAVVTTTGGGAAAVADRLGMLGLELPVPPQAFVDAMAGAGVRLPRAPVLDLTLAVTPERYAAVLAALLDAGFCDVVLAVVGSSAQFRPDLAVAPIVAAPRDSKPLAVFLLPEATDSLARLAAAGIAGFRTPEACADALCALSAWRAPRSLAGPEVSLAAAFAGRQGRIDEAGAMELVRRAGVAVAPGQVIDAPGVTVDVPGPWVVKILSADIAHKSDVGGVRTGLSTAEQRDAAIAALPGEVAQRCPQARLSGVYVQSHESGVLEAIVGYRRDPQVGPVVLIGSGGIEAEIWSDAAVALAPVDRDEALALIDRVPSLRRRMDGFRGAPPGDRAALADVLVALSRLACIPGTPVVEAELNPVVVRAEGRGAVAVDALMVLD